MRKVSTTVYTLVCCKVCRMKKHNQKRKLNFDRYTVTRINYEQEYPFDVFPRRSIDQETTNTWKARSISEAIKKYTKWTDTKFNFEEINSKSAIGYSKETQGRWEEEDWKKYCELSEIHQGLANLFQQNYILKSTPSYYIEQTSVAKIIKVENQVMKSDYIKSNSKLAKWIHKRFVKYADQLGVSVPRYYINRRDIVERMGSYALDKTNDSGCIGRCWFTSEVIWIDVNFHDKRYGSDQKAFRKKLDHTIAHEMLHLKFKTAFQHKGSKQRRAFDRRTNQLMRGKKYD